MKNQNDHFPFQPIRQSALKKPNRLRYNQLDHVAGYICSDLHALFGNDLTKKNSSLITKKRWTTRIHDAVCNAENSSSGG